MKRRPRIYYTAAQKALMWDRWKAGDTLHEMVIPPFLVIARSRNAMWPWLAAVWE